MQLVEQRMMTSVSLSIEARFSCVVGLRLPARRCCILTQPAKRCSCQEVFVGESCSFDAILQSNLFQGILRVERCRIASVHTTFAGSPPLSRSPSPIPSLSRSSRSAPPSLRSALLAPSAPRLPPRSGSFPPRKWPRIAYLLVQKRVAARKAIFKRAEQYVKEYRSAERNLVRLRRQAKKAGNFFREPEAKLAFVIRIRGYPF